LAACATTAALIANGTQQTHASACLRDDEASSLRKAALDPATWQRSSNFAMS